jgi:hypothetical protein
VGGSGTSPLISEGSDHFYSYCTGNSVLDYCLVSWNVSRLFNWQCLKRQDSLAHLYQIYAGASDELTIEIVPKKELAKAMVFTVTNRRCDGEVRRECYEIV